MADPYLSAIHVQHLDGNPNNNHPSNLAFSIDVGQVDAIGRIMATRPRDSQLSKFWKAFEKANPPEITPVDATVFLDGLSKSRWWKNRCDDKVTWAYTRAERPELVPEKFHHPGTDDWYRIEISQNEKLSKLRLLVSAAHLLQPENTAWHGPEYGRILLEMVDKYIGRDERDELRTALRANRFKLSKWSEEAKQRKREQHAEAKVVETLAEWSAKLGPTSPDE